jgi:hypothetical protein
VYAVRASFLNRFKEIFSDEKSPNDPTRRAILCLVTALCGLVPALPAQRPRLILDQDARGPASTDLNSVLLFAQSRTWTFWGHDRDGDQWVKEETAYTLRALEIAGRTDIPVIPGAEGPLINSEEESEIWEQQFGTLNFKVLGRFGRITLPTLSPSWCRYAYNEGFE